jgi:predicted alpha/beta hydrolase family esterase
MGMRTSEADIIIVPGLSGGTEHHWYSRWESKLPTAKRVIQADWHNPNLDAWTESLVSAVAHAAAKIAERVVGAFLVAPPSPAVMLTIPQVDKAFADVPRDPLPFPAVLIASRDDSYSAYADSEALAQSWHVELVDAGESGHLNDESGHGPWPEGLMRFASFMRTL